MAQNVEKCHYGNRMLNCVFVCIMYVRKYSLNYKKGATCVIASKA